MIAPLIEHLQSYIPVSEDLRARLPEIAFPLVMGKSEYLHKPGNICTQTYFIVSGLVAISYEKGEKSITDNFAAEGEWVTSIYSFMRHAPDNFYIQVLERSELLAIDMDDLERCFVDFPEMERFGRLLISQYFMEQSERIISMQFHSARERYDFYCASARNKVHRVPLGMLASHLGMTQETLSRLRGERSAF